MKIAIIQTDSRERDIEYNFSHCEELIKEACKEKPDVLVLPEMWNTGFFPEKSEESLFDENGNRSRELLRHCSEENNILIVGGSVAERKDGNLYNTSYVYNEKGENIASYSKTHLFSFMGEDKVFTAGDKVSLFSINGIRAAVVICYDIRFPELIRTAALEGIELLFVVSQWPYERLSQLDILCKCRAVENQMHVVLCNGCGSYSGTRFAGGSGVFDCFGNKTFSLGNEEGILLCDISFEEQRALRSTMKVYEDRRPQIYKL